MKIGQSIVSDNVVSMLTCTSNWSNLGHAFASRGFVSDSCAFLLPSLIFLSYPRLYECFENTNRPNNSSCAFVSAAKRRSDEGN